MRLILQVDCSPEYLFVRVDQWVAESSNSRTPSFGPQRIRWHQRIGNDTIHHTVDRTPCYPGCSISGRSYNRFCRSLASSCLWIVQSRFFKLCWVEFRTSIENRTVVQFAEFLKLRKRFIRRKILKKTECYHLQSGLLSFGLTQQFLAYAGLPRLFRYL